MWVRSCCHCGEMVGADPGDTEWRPDPCLGLIPGVEFACCGHNEPGGYPYVVVPRDGFGTPLAEYLRRRRAAGLSTDGLRLVLKDDFADDPLGRPLLSFALVHRGEVTGNTR